MDPQFEKTPGLALPNPATEQGFHAAPQPATIPHEAMLPRAESVPNLAGAPPIAVSQVPITPVQPTPMAASSVQNAAVAAQATPSDDNTDALDEEWISKAKAIVEQTKHDPHLESAELSKVKAEYLRIRYNKHIKVVEESSK